MYEEEEDDVFANQELIHIHKINTRGRKKETRVIGIPDIFDFKKILKFWKKNFQTNGRITKEGKQTREKGKKRQKEDDEESQNQGQTISVQGDHREQIKHFLVFMGIADKQNIRVHGAS